ncbi:Cytochrome P450 [Apiospora marii]|uniref:Cytochrome P450 n=1 Tax=Apiospora marii TaxID=335849 RepID=A0ABR1R3B0_9PEZI
MHIKADGAVAVMRSPGARPDGGKSFTCLWDDANIGVFKSERWLKRDPELGTERFVPMDGLRGCFGKKLVLQALNL